MSSAILFLALVILIAVRFVVGRGLRPMLANAPLAEAGPVRLHPRVSHGILDLGDRREVPNRCEPRLAKK